jgi:hypothetical protein
MEKEEGRQIKERRGQGEAEEREIEGGYRKRKWEEEK